MSSAGITAMGCAGFQLREEGYLLMGSIIEQQRLTIIGNVQATAKLGAAIAQSSNGNIALAAYNLYQFTTSNRAVKPAAAHPARFTLR